MIMSSNPGGVISTFQKCHYDAIAAVLRDAATPQAYDLEHSYDRLLGEDMWRFIAHKFATLFMRDNPNFSIDRFFDAAGVPRKEGK